MGFSSEIQKNLIKFNKSGIKSLLNPNVFAAGAVVEATLLDSNGNETSQKSIGRIDKDGDIAEINSEEKGMSLGEPGVYVIKYYGAGMLYLDTGDNIEKPFQEIYDVVNTFSRKNTNLFNTFNDLANHTHKVYINGGIIYSWLIDGVESLI